MINARRHLMRDARDPWIVLGLFVLAVVLPGIVATIGGAILIPHNDDFAYRRVATTLLDEGRLQFTGWSVMTLLGQVFVTMPFLWLLGGSAWGFALSSAMFVGIGIAASYHLARRLLTPPRATFAILMVLFIPGLLRDTTTFMTDLPAYAGEMLCMTLGAAAVHRTNDEHRWRWMVISLLVGWWAFSIHEFALAAPVAVLLVAFLSDPDRRRARYAIAGGALLVACAATYFIIAAMPGQGISTVPAFGPEEVPRTIHASSTLAFLLAPALVLSAATWIPRWLALSDRVTRRRAVIGGALGFGVAAVLFAGDIALVPQLNGTTHLRTIVGNVFARTGSPEANLLAGVRPAVFPFAFWDVINVVALVAAFVGFTALGAATGVGGRRLMRALDPRQRPTELGSAIGVLLVFTALYVGGIAVFGITQAMFDRYLWPLVFTLSVLLLWRPPQAAALSRGFESRSPDVRRRIAAIANLVAGAMLATTATMAVMLLLNSVAYEGALWRAGESEVARGIPPMSIDAGLDWLGLHATGDIAQVDAPNPVDRARDTKFWPSYRQCVVVTNSPVKWSGVTLAEKRDKAYRMFLFKGAWRPLYIYRSTDRNCAG